MMRNLKALGLALVAMLTMGALAASGAQAQGVAQLTMSESATLVGTQTGANTVFSRQGRVVTCEVATYHGNVSNGDQTITIHPTYSGCHSTNPFTGATWPATVTFPEACNYVFHLTGDAKEGGGEDTWTASADLACTGGAEVAIHVYENATKHANNENLCTFNFSSQSGLQRADLTNEAGANNKITAHLNFGGISSTRTAGGAFLCGSETDSAGTLVGTALLEGENEVGGVVGTTVSTVG